jgi:hypothetical protein
MGTGQKNRKSESGELLSPSGGQRLLDVLRQTFRGIGGRVAPDHLPVLANQELGEIPLDGLAAQDAGRFGGQPLVQRVGLWAIDVDLGHHRETHTVVELAEAGDLFIAARILRAELVAGKTEHDETLGAPGLMQGFQTGELWREAAGAGGVHDQQCLALVFFQGNGFAAHRLGGEFVDGRHRQAFRRLSRGWCGAFATDATLKRVSMAPGRCHLTGWGHSGE